jgi:hypothetical protein
MELEILDYSEKIEEKEKTIKQLKEELFQLKETVETKETKKGFFRSLFQRLTKTSEKNK